MPHLSYKYDPKFIQFITEKKNASAFEGEWLITHIVDSLIIAYNKTNPDELYIKPVTDAEMGTARVVMNSLIREFEQYLHSDI